MLRLRQEALAWSEVGGETVLLDLESSSYFVVKGSGGYIINCLAEGVTEDGLADRVVENFEVDLDRAKADIADFLKALEERGMIERSADEG